MFVYNGLELRDSTISVTQLVKKDWWKQVKHPDQVDYKKLGSLFTSSDFFLLICCLLWLKLCP